MVLRTCSWCKKFIEPGQTAVRVIIERKETHTRAGYKQKYNFDKNTCLKKAMIEFAEQLGKREF